MLCRKANWPATALLILTATMALGAGCRRGPAVVPVEGRVLHNGEPLKFGSVMFQPDSGQPARGQIRADGKFVLSTYVPGDGAKVGRHRVRITCYTSQRPGVLADKSRRELSLGKLLIPRRYTKYSTSGFEVEVLGEGNEPFQFHLTDE